MWIHLSPGLMFTNEASIVTTLEFSSQEKYSKFSFTFIEEEKKTCQFLLFPIHVNWEQVRNFRYNFFSERMTSALLESLLHLLAYSCVRNRRIVPWRAEKIPWVEGLIYGQCKTIHSRGYYCFRWFCILISCPMLYNLIYYCLATT